MSREKKYVEIVLSEEYKMKTNIGIMAYSV